MAERKAGGEYKAKRKGLYMAQGQSFGGVVDVVGKGDNETDFCI